MKNYNYTIYTEITRAFSKYNRLVADHKTRLTILDANILSLLKSFARAKAQFYMSNKELGEIMISDPTTIQRSINRLIAVGLVKKETMYMGQKPQRILTYQEQAIKNIINLY